MPVLVYPVHRTVASDLRNDVVDPIMVHGLLGYATVSTAVHDDNRGECLLRDALALGMCPSERGHPVDAHAALPHVS